MRKIITKEEKERKTRRNQLIIGAILIGVMILSTAGYSFMDRGKVNSDDKITYNGIEFTRDTSSGYWNFYVNNNKFTTKHSPNETEDIQTPIFRSINNFAGKHLYVISDYNDPNVEIYTNLNPSASRINPACLSENCSGDYPIKNCSEDNMIIVREPINESSRIYQEENCIFIIAPFENQTMYTDAFLFKILGIQ
jgi:hypothetical protein